MSTSKAEKHPMEAVFVIFFIVNILHIIKYSDSVHNSAGFISDFLIKKILIIFYKILKSSY